MTGSGEEPSGGTNSAGGPLSGGSGGVPVPNDRPANTLVPTSDFEVFTAEDGQPALRMTAEAQIVGLRAQAQRYREEIGGYKRTQDELTDALATAEAELRELKRTMRDIGQVRGIPDEVGQGS